MNYSFWYVLFALLAFFVVLNLIGRWRRQVEQVKWNQVYESPVVCAAASFWKESLCRDFTPALTEAQLEEFYQVVRTGIAKEMLKEGLVVSMGMIGRRQAGFFAVPDIDDILKAAGLQLSYLRQVRIDLASYLPMIEMRIYEDKVQVREMRTPGRFEDFYVLYQTGDRLDVMLDWAQAHQLPEPCSMELRI